MLKSRLKIKNFKMLSLVVIFSLINILAIGDTIDEYKNLPKNNVFVERDKDFLKGILVGKVDGIVVIGSPRCRYCQRDLPVIDEVAKEMGVKEVYYINSDILRDTRERERLRGMPYNMRYIPYIFQVRNGKYTISTNDTKRSKDIKKKYEIYFKELKKQG